MKHIAIDLGGRESQICVRNEDGTIVEEKRIETRRLPSYLARQERSRVIVETCAEGFWVADAAEAAGHEVRVVPATLVGTLGVGARGMKTDRRDARILSEVSCRIDLPSVHVPSSLSRQCKTICSMREALVSSRTKLVNCARGWLRSQGVSLRGRRIAQFPERLREHCLRDSDEVPAHIERMAVAIEQLTAQIKEATKELDTLAKQDERCARMMSVPGVGPVTATRFAAAIDDIDRFPNAHAVQSYLGLTPGERSSSERTQRTGITKAGSPATRWALIQAAWSAWRTRPHDRMVQWARRVAERRGTKVAVTALARKLAGILYAIWRDDTRYDATRGATQFELRHVRLEAVPARNCTLSAE